MTTTKLYGKDLSAYADIDIDDLLSKLTEEEIEELGTDLIDPDDSCIPPSDRCKYRLDKKPTGPYNRKHLIDFLEKKAKEEKDWEEAKPYIKEIRGKVWKPKEVNKVQLNEDEDIETEWDDVLANATEEELVDLAAILGFHGMLNQVQYHHAFVSGEKDDDGNDDDDDDDEDGEKKKKKSGFQGVAKAETFKQVENEPPNSTDYAAALQQVKDNDPALKELNLNNIKNIPLKSLKEFGEALKTNTNLVRFSLANTSSTDRVAKAFAEGLKENGTLEALNMESNYISADGIIAIFEAVNEKQKVSELRLVNQRPAVIGVRKEMRIADLMFENRTIQRLGLHLETSDAKVRVREYLKRNGDRVRQDRVSSSGKDGSSS